VEVLPADDACDACQEWKGKKIPLKKLSKSLLCRLRIVIMKHMVIVAVAIFLLWKNNFREIKEIIGRR